MASTNPFDLLGDDDNDDPSLLIAKLPVAVATTKKSPVGGVAAKPVAKLPSKPIPPSQAVREAKTDGQRGGRFGGNGTGRGGRGGGRGFNRDSNDTDEEPEDQRIVARLNRMEANMNRGFYNLSLLIRGQQVPDDAFPAPDDAGPSNPRPARQQRRRRHE